MRAMIYTRYGSPDVFQLRELPQPVPKRDEILVTVRAATVTAADWRMRKAQPFAARLFNGLFRPLRVSVLGFEFSGEVERVGGGVTRFKVGDAVFGHNDFRFGAYAEYVCVPVARMLATRPANVSWEQAAAVPFGGLAALNLLRKGGIQNGQNVLVYGASGSTGTFAVQLARNFGASVTGVCSGRNVDLVRSLGAQHVVDYTAEDFRKTGKAYDLILDAVGRMISGLSPADFRACLAPGGRYVSVEMDRKDRPEDLAFLAQLLESGKLRTVIDKRYPFEHLAEAHRYVEKGHKKGNVVVTISPSAAGEASGNAPATA
jgi:NADPH:quinone reductase-like Zn-dependent oxidoreductase